MDFLLSNIVYVAVALVSGGMLIWPLLRGNAGCPMVSPLEATMRINRQDALVLDVREAAQYEQGHLPRARNVPTAQLQERLSELARHRNRPVIVACDSGTRSAPAVAILKKAGFTDVLALEGGVAAWRRAELPVEK